jgi:hypothetical protein
MSNQKSYSKRNFLLKDINPNSLSGSKSNLFQFFKNNSEIHEDAKYKVYKELIKRGFEVFIEPEFKNKSRPDILAISPESNGLIVEIVSSESEKSQIEKINKYDIEFELIFIDANKQLNLQLPEILI